MLLIFNDEYSKVLGENGVQFIQFDDVAAMFLNELLTGSIGYAIEYNEHDITPEIFNQYVAYVAENIDAKKYYTKVGKLQQDILNMVNDVTKNKHEEIMNFVPPQPEPAEEQQQEEVEGE